jgi:hypothetical protein
MRRNMTEDKLGRDVAVSLVVHGVFEGDEPTPQQLAEWAEPLKAFKLSELGGVLMGIRLAIRWFGLTAHPRMGHIRRHETIEGALTMTLSVEHDMLKYVEFALRQAGFTDFDRNGAGVSGTRVRFTVPQEIAERYGTVPLQ